MLLDKKILRKIAEKHYYSQSGYLKEYNEGMTVEEMEEDKESIDEQESWVEDAIKQYLETTKNSVVVRLEMTKDEARKLLHCLKRTSARNNYSNMVGILDTCEEIEEIITKQL